MTIIETFIPTRANLIEVLRRDHADKVPPPLPHDEQLVLTALKCVLKPMIAAGASPHFVVEGLPLFHTYRDFIAESNMASCDQWQWIGVRKMGTFMFPIIRNVWTGETAGEMTFDEFYSENPEANEQQPGMYARCLDAPTDADTLFF